MTENVERYQVFIYVAAAVLGAAAGLTAPNAVGWIEALVWPALALLLYATFCQVRVAEAVRAFNHGRFFAASLVANFLLVPLLVWALSTLLLPDPAVRLGVLLVLLVPCTDWFVTFTHLGGGDSRLATAVVPVQLLIQFLALPLYLWVILGREFVGAVAVGPFLQVFTGLIVAPFALAALTRHMADRSPLGADWLRVTSRLPIPLLALVILLVAGSQAPGLGGALGALGWAAVVFVVYVLVAAPLGRVVAGAFRLEVGAGRTLAFNVGTRNSFVVLPLALALPAGWEAAAAAIVLQSVIELAGLIGYLRVVPGWLLRAPAGKP